MTLIFFICTSLSFRDFFFNGWLDPADLSDPVRLRLYFRLLFVHPVSRIKWRRKQDYSAKVSPVSSNNVLLLCLINVLEATRASAPLIQMIYRRASPVTLVLQPLNAVRVMFSNGLTGMELVDSVTKSVTLAAWFCRCQPSLFSHAV